ncbi:radical SAM protein [Merdimonas faecis]
MEYEGQICRAPMERASFMLPVVVGCAYNRCKFCDLFKHLKYRELPLEQIEEELKRVRDIGGNPRRVFLGDGSAFTLSMEKLLAVLELIHQYFPGCESVNMDATVSSILNKTPKELKTLYENGVRHLYIGIESGLDDVLRFMDKDHGLLEAYEAASQLNRAGLIFDAHIMTGVAGKGRGIENAKALAEFFNRTRPKLVVKFSMFLHRKLALYREIQAGNFAPADELENLKEERYLIGHLEAQDGIIYDGFHDFLEFRVRGRLLEDREKMLGKLDGIIETNVGQGVYAYIG